MVGSQHRSVPEPSPLNSEWEWDAKCRTRNPEIYDTISVPFNSNHPRHFTEARARCQGCPVKRQCATEALHFKEVGVVRAGVPLQDSIENNTVRGLYGMLEQVSRGETPELPEPKLACRAPDTEFIEGIPGPDDPTHFLLGGDWYVGRAGAAELIGYSVRTLDNYRAWGALNIPVRYIRRSIKAGQASAYYKVVDVYAEKEKLDRVRATRRQETTRV